jgi:hypothetical protein
MKKLLPIIFIFIFGLFACNSQTSQKTIESNLTATQVIDAFKKANLPVSDELIYTEESDPNHLLNRPNQYTQKINFDDKRATNNESPLGNSIEIFQNSEDLNKRKTYIETISKSMSMLSEYDFAHKNVLLRLNHILTPAQANEYETVLNGL